MCMTHDDPDFDNIGMIEGLARDVQLDVVRDEGEQLPRQQHRNRAGP